MAAKSHLRNGRPVLIAPATNDALAGALENIGKLMCRKNYFFVPFGQDDPIKKPTSMVADFTKIPQAMAEALCGQQLQPILL
jgi:dipicolinate synthase subunit B